MAVAVPLMAAPSARTGTAVASGGMAGMAMGGQAAATTDAAIGMPIIGSAGWAATVCLILAAALLAGGVWQATAAIRPLAAPAHGPLTPALRGHAGVMLGDGAGALMAVGMAVALLEMA
jgi:hypothetical protein